MNDAEPELMFTCVMANNFGLLGQNYYHLLSCKEHAVKEGVHPYRHTLSHGLYN